MHLNGKKNIASSVLSLPVLKYNFKIPAISFPASSPRHPSWRTRRRLRARCPEGETFRTSTSSQTTSRPNGADLEGAKLSTGTIHDFLLFVIWWTNITLFHQEFSSIPLYETNSIWIFHGSHFSYFLSPSSQRGKYRLLKHF